MDKERSMDIHVIKRFRERFNFKATKEDIDHIVHMIKTNMCNGAEPVYKQSNMRTVWKINYKDLDFLAVYNRSKHRLSTVMPLDWISHIKYTIQDNDSTSDETIGILEEEKSALNTTINTLKGIEDLMNSEEIICYDSNEIITKDDLNVCRQILELLSTSEYLESVGLQTDENLI